MRGSDPDATVFYLARALNAGEDPVFMARRIVIAASEDVLSNYGYVLIIISIVLITKQCEVESNSNSKSEMLLYEIFKQFSNKNLINTQVNTYLYKKIYKKIRI